MLKIIVQTLLNIDNKDKCNIRPNSHLTIQFPLVLTFNHLATGVSMLFLTVQYGKLFYYLLCKINILYVSDVMRKPVNAICEQQRRRSACECAQSDQRLCCSLPG